MSYLNKALALTSITSNILQLTGKNYIPKEVVAISELSRISEFLSSMGTDLEQLQDYIKLNPIASYATLSFLEYEFDNSWVKKVYFPTENYKINETIPLLAEIKNNKLSILQQLTSPQKQQAERIASALVELQEMQYLYAFSGIEKEVRRLSEEITSLSEEIRKLQGDGSKDATKKRNDISRKKEAASQKLDSINRIYDKSYYLALYNNYFPKLTRDEFDQRFQLLDELVNDAYHDIKRPDQVIPVNDNLRLEVIFERAWVGRLTPLLCKKLENHVPSRFFRYMSLMIDASYTQNPIDYIISVYSNKKVDYVGISDEVIKSCFLYKRSKAKKETYYLVATKKKRERAIVDLFEEDIFRGMFVSRDRNYLDDDFYEKVKYRNAYVGFPSDIKQKTFEQYIRGEISRYKFRKAREQWHHDKVAEITKAGCGMLGAIPIFAIFIAIVIAMGLH